MKNIRDHCRLEQQKGIKNRLEPWLTTFVKVKVGLTESFFTVD